MRCLLMASHLCSPPRPCQGPWHLPGAGEPSWAHAAELRVSWAGEGQPCPAAWPALSRRRLTGGGTAAMGPQCQGSWGAAEQGGGVGVCVPQAVGAHWSRGAGWCVGARDPRGAPEQGFGVLTVPLTTRCSCFLPWALLGRSSGLLPKSLPCGRFPPLSFPPFIFGSLQAAPETRGL